MEVVGEDEVAQRVGLGHGWTLELEHVLTERCGVLPQSPWSYVLVTWSSQRTQVGVLPVKVACVPDRVHLHSRMNGVRKPTLPTSYS